MDSSTAASPAAAMRLGGEGTGRLSSSQKCSFLLARMAVWSQSRLPLISSTGDFWACHPQPTKDSKGFAAATQLEMLFPFWCHPVCPQLLVMPQGSSAGNIEWLVGNRVATYFGSIMFRVSCVIQCFFALFLSPMTAFTESTKESVYLN